MSETSEILKKLEKEGIYLEYDDLLDGSSLSIDNYYTTYKEEEEFKGAIKELSIYETNISEKAFSLLADMKYLTHLMLIRNNIKKIPDCLSKLKNLYDLNLSENDITEVSLPFVKEINCNIDLTKNDIRLSDDIIEMYEDDYGVIIDNKKLVPEKVKVLFVEDKYDKIYKIAWLKLTNITFEENNIDEVFSKKSDFDVIGLEGAGAVSGLLRSKNIMIYKNKKVIGLFDFDKEGSENFYLLKRDKYWTKKVQGDKNSCFYRKRKDHPFFYAILLPVPKRISHLADLKHENFSNYIEIENLLPEKFLKDNNLVDERTIVGVSYFKIKEKVKRSLWKKIVNLEKEYFMDFSPIYKMINRKLST